jgi:hypothetical protein
MVDISEGNTHLQDLEVDNIDEKRIYVVEDGHVGQVAVSFQQINESAATIKYWEFLHSRSNHLPLSTVNVKNT